MAATLCYMNFRTGFVEDKALIKEVLTEKIGKKFKIAYGSLANTGRECTPVHVMFTNKYDTRMLCRIEDTEVYELLFCNQLMELPIKDNPLPKCTMKVAPLTFDEVKSYLNSVIRLVERKPREWARRDMIKRMLRADDVDRIPCNHCPPFNSHLFSKKRIIQYQTEIKTRPACPFGGYVDFTRFSEGICTNNRCFHCIPTQYFWNRNKRVKIFEKFWEWMKHGMCNSCYYVRMNTLKKQWYGNDVKLAATVFNSARAKAILKTSNIPKDNDDRGWVTSDEDSDPESVSSVDSDPEHFELFEEYFPTPRLVEPITLEEFQERP